MNSYIANIVHALEDRLADLHEDHTVAESAAVLLGVFGINRGLVSLDAHDRLLLLHQVNLGVVHGQLDAVSTLLDGVDEVLGRIGPEVLDGGAKGVEIK